MNPITLPIIITIAVIGVIAIILVKLFYKDPEVSDLSDDLPPIVSKHWEEPFKDDVIENKDPNDHDFVTKSWEEPMGKNQELKNGIASKVFQEPMHSKHQDIISKDYEKEGNVSYIQTENAQINREYGENKQSNLDSFENENYDNQDNFNDFESFEDFEDFESNDLKENPNESNFDDANYTNENNDHYNTNITENNDGSFRISKSEKDPNYLNSEYITPKEYSSQNYDEYGNINEINEIDQNRDIYTENNRDYSNSYENDNEYSDSKNSNSYEEEHLANSGVFDMGEQVIVGGKPYTIKVGDDIIFNYNGESYSSRILEIKHENIRVKYRAQEKWISFSDIKKVF